MAKKKLRVFIFFASLPNDILKFSQNGSLNIWSAGTFANPITVLADFKLPLIWFILDCKIIDFLNFIFSQLSYFLNT